MKHLLIAFLVGVIATTAGLGTLGYLKMQETHKEHARLQTLIKKKNWQLDNLKSNQSRLKNELESFKAAKEKTYDTTIGALMHAKENAGLEALYEMGSKALAEKDYPRAYFALAQVKKNNPKYKAIAEQYPLAEKAYKKHQQETLSTKLKTTYAKAIDHQTKNQFAQAKAHYEQVVKMQPDFKDAKTRLQNVNNYLATQTKTRERAQKKAWLTATYKLGFNHQANGRYAQAKEAYQQVLKDSPLYKDTAKRFKVVMAKLPKPTAPPVPKAPVQTVNCYEKGAAIGQCAMSPQSPACSNMQSSPPVECNGNPEFMRGYKSTVKQDPNGLLKGLSSVLKNF